VLNGSDRKESALKATQFIQLALNEFHRSVVQEIRDLTPEQMTYQAAPGASTISFLVWHASRTEDAVFHRVATPEGAPPLWETEEWYKRFGLEATEGGTGFSPEQVAGFAPPKELLVAYTERVAEAVTEGLGRLADEDLDRVLNPDNPRMTVGRQIQSIIVGHVYWHLGEVGFIKGLQGMPFPR
jgi:hypothetical protein